ncbi:MAG TPA: hypothetical protein PKD11_01370 [Pyrinomonadaceae bacterium]|nr:hypothetical protein [Pyrinomonadaceae bacterium]
MQRKMNPIMKIWLSRALALMMVAAASVTFARANEAETNYNPTLSFVITHYRLYIQPAPQYSWSSRLIVRSSNQSCQLIFIKTGNNIPQNSVSADGLSGVFYLPESMLDSVMELVRKSSSVRVTIAGTSLIGTISNNNEEVPGSGE